MIDTLLDTLGYLATTYGLLAATFASGFTCALIIRDCHPDFLRFYQCQWCGWVSARRPCGHGEGAVNVLALTDKIKELLER